MSYAAAAALQAAIYQKLSGALSLNGVDVVDALPAHGGKGTFVILGPETVTDKSDKTGAGAEHLVQISVISDATGFMAAKTAAAAVSSELVDAPLTLSAGHLVALGFVRASARRLDAGASRRIDLTFRARIDF